MGLGDQLLTIQRRDYDAKLLQYAAFLRGRGDSSDPADVAHIQELMVALGLQASDVINDLAALSRIRELSAQQLSMEQVARRVGELYPERTRCMEEWAAFLGNKLQNLDPIGLDRLTTFLGISPVEVGQWGGRIGQIDEFQFREPARQEAIRQEISRLKSEAPRLCWDSPAIAVDPVVVTSSIEQPAVDPDDEPNADVDDTPATTGVSETDSMPQIQWPGDNDVREY